VLHARLMSLGANSLSEVLQCIRGISGLEVKCVSYPPSACNLVEVLLADTGYAPSSGLMILIDFRVSQLLGRGACNYLAA
jgi:hypothetical protein